MQIPTKKLNEAISELKQLIANNKDFPFYNLVVEAPYAKSIQMDFGKIIKNNLGMRAAIERLHIGGMLIGIACDLFIRHDGKATDGE